MIRAVTQLFAKEDCTLPQAMFSKFHHQRRWRWWRLGGGAGRFMRALQDEWPALLALPMLYSSPTVHRSSEKDLQRAKHCLAKRCQRLVDNLECARYLRWRLIWLCAVGRLYYSWTMCWVHILQRSAFCVFLYYLCLFMLLCSHSTEHDAHIVQKGGALVQANDTHTQWELGMVDCCRNRQHQYAFNHPWGSDASKSEGLS